MANYKKMYICLFREVTKAIDILENAQQATEETFIETAPDSDGAETVDFIRRVSDDIRRNNPDKKE